VERQNLIKLNNMSFERSDHSASWFKDKFIVVAGGHKPNFSLNKSCEIYNVEADSWENLPDLNIAREY
jgi:hypothetical protein